MQIFFNRLGILLTGLFVLFFTNDLVKADDVKDFLGDGMPSLNEQNYKSLISSYDEKIQLSPTNLMFRIEKVKIYLQLGKYDDALAECDKFILQSTNLAGRAIRGLTYYAKGDYDKAISDLSECIRIKPIAASYLVRASAYEKKGDIDKALSDYTAAINLKPEDAHAYFLRGNVFGSKGDFDKAIANFDMAIQIFPGYAQAYSNRGFAWSKKGDYVKAIADCSQSLILNSNDAGANNNLAWILSTAPDDKLRDGQKALLYAERACTLTMWKEPYSLGTLAAACAEIGNFDGAVKWEKKSMESGLPEKELKQAQARLDLYQQRKPYHAELLQPK